MKNACFTLLLSLFVLLGCQKNKVIGEFVKTPSPLSITRELEDSGLFVFGHMKVPERAANPEGKTVELAVAIFKCRADSVSQDPLVLCAGGPGLSNIDDFVPGLVGGLGNLFLNTRDVVIIESRGLKYSKPYLNVPGFEQLQLSLLEKNLTADQTINMYIDTLQVAYDRFTAQGIDLSAINSLEISNEIAYVMEQLGYEQFSMFGTSYGTEVVQYMLMNHADRLNSVVMNGTMDTSLGGYHMHTSLIEILESLFDTIEADPIYSEAYPNLKKRFLDKISELNLKPETIQIKYLKNEQEYDVKLNGNRIAVWLFYQMYNNTQIQLSIHKIVNGDFSEIIASPGIIFPIPEFSTGLSLSVFLSETSDIKPKHIPLDNEYAELIKGTSLSMFGPYFWRQAYKVWPVKPREAIKPIKTNVPILMLGGKFDYLCRPSYAKEFAAQQENAYLYIFDDVAHSPVDKGSCAIMMLKEFFDNPGKAPDSSCMEEFEYKMLLPE